MEISGKPYIYVYTKMFSHNYVFKNLIEINYLLYFFFVVLLILSYINLLISCFRQKKKRKTKIFEWLFYLSFFFLFFLKWRKSVSIWKGFCFIDKIWISYFHCYVLQFLVGFVFRRKRYHINFSGIVCRKQFFFFNIPRCRYSLCTDPLNKLQEIISTNYLIQMKKWYKWKQNRKIKILKIFIQSPETIKRKFKRSDWPKY